MKSMPSLIARRDALRWLVGTVGTLQLFGCGGGNGDGDDATPTELGRPELDQAGALQPVGRYRLTDLGRLDPDLPSFGAAVNAHGQATGSSRTFASGADAIGHAFLYSNGSMQDLGPPGIPSEGADINDSAQICGSVQPAQFMPRGFLYSGVVMQDIGTLGGQETSCAGINNSGQITGWSKTASGRIHAFLYAGGSMQDLGTPGADETLESFGTAINDAGVVVGYTVFAAIGLLHHAFVLRDGQMEDLGVIGGDGSQAFAINVHGDITGRSTTAPATEMSAFLYSQGAMRSIGPVGSTGHGINASGWVVGSFRSCDLDGNNPVGHAFLYDGSSLLDLNALLDDSGQGWVVTSANDINDAGQIIGTANAPVPFTSVGNDHAVLLTPVSTE
jgi:probable HAF family extracellular repeat protein